MNAAMQHLQLATSAGSPIIRIAMGPEGTNFAFIELRTEEVCVPNCSHCYVLFRGTILNRTYGTDNNLYISIFLLTIFGPIYYGPP